MMVLFGAYYLPIVNLFCSINLNFMSCGGGGVVPFHVLSTWPKININIPRLSFFYVLQGWAITCPDCPGQRLTDPRGHKQQQTYRGTRKNVKLTFYFPKKVGLATKYRVDNNKQSWGWTNKIVKKKLFANFPECDFTPKKVWPLK